MKPRTNSRGVLLVVDLQNDSCPGGALTVAGAGCLRSRSCDLGQHNLALSPIVETRYSQSTE
jgi:nicotinamidase-related amidase